MTFRQSAETTTAPTIICGRRRCYWDLLDRLLGGWTARTQACYLGGRDSLWIFKPTPAGQPVSPELLLQTAAGNDIPNVQATEIFPNERAAFREIERRWGQVLHRRCAPTARFNCHGLTFGSRRTEITDAPALQMILLDDSYTEIQAAHVLPGDVILYFAPNGEVDHSGIVLSRPADEQFGIPKVMSKWGKYAEVIHWANRCPYEFVGAKYYRIQQ